MPSHLHYPARILSCFGPICGVGSVVMILLGVAIIFGNTPAPKTGTQCRILDQNVTCETQKQSCSPYWDVEYLDLAEEKEIYAYDQITNAPKFTQAQDAWIEAYKYQINQTYPCYYRHVTFFLSDQDLGLYFYEHQTGTIILGTLLITISILIMIFIFCFSICYEVEIIEDNPPPIEMRSRNSLLSTSSDGEEINDLSSSTSDIS